MANYKDLRYVFPASSITSGTFNDARIAASNVSQHAQSFDDNKIVNDISTLGLRVHTQENLNASNTNSASFDVFQDSSGITNLTNASRNASEFISATSTGADPNAISIFRPNTTDHSSSTTSVSSSVSGDSATLAKVNTSLGGNNLQSLAPFSGGMSFTAANNDDGGWKINPTSAYDFGTNDFTIESWARRFGSDGSNHQYIIDWEGTNNYDRLSLAFRDGNNAYLGQAIHAEYDYTTDLETSGFFTPQNTWIHWAYVKESGTMSIYINGNRKRTTSSYASACNYNSARTGVLAFNQRHGSDSTGYCDFVYTSEIRISNNARYSGATYTVPSASFPVNIETVSATGSFEGNAITASSTNKMGAVITYQDQAGTNALNTDIILKLSADNGSNYSTATLTALPDFATGIKMAKVNDLSVTAGTQLKYKIEFANQSAGSKEARIRGVSLQY
jgi:hypothetical protein